MPFRVFVIQENPKLNLTPALKYGNLVKIFPAKELRVDSVTLAKVARETLKDFDSEKDFILLMGDPAAIAIVSGVLFEAAMVQNPSYFQTTGNRVYFNTLKYNNVTASYSVYRIEL